MSVNGKLIELARIARGLQQIELAEWAGFSQSKVSKCERGQLQVSDSDLEKFAQVLRYPTSFFHRNDQIYGFGSVCLYHRKRKSLNVTELERIHAQINIMRMHVAPLLRGVTIKPPYDLPHMDVDEIAGGPQEIARRTRGGWRMPIGPVNSMLNLIEDAGIVVVGCSLGTRLLDAVSHWPKDHAPFLFVNTDVTAGDRIRFTLAHELGHMIMRNHASADPEREANRFAAEFLMPAAEIKRDLANLTIPRAASLKAYWKVSIQAIVEWAKALGCITEGRHRSLRIAINDFRTDEPVPIAPETPTTLPELIQVYFDSLKYNISQLCDVMTIYEDEFRRLFVPPSPETGFRIYC